MPKSTRVNRTLELTQEAHVAFQQHSKVGYVVLQASHTFHAHAEGKAGIHLRVDAGHAQNVRVNHATAQNLQPASAFAHAATFAVVQVAGAAAYAAAYVGFSRRLREREEMCAETRFAIGAEHLLAEVFERALQVAERDVLVYHQAFALRELGKVRRISNVATVYLARSNDVNRKILVFHNVNLNAGSLSA